MKRHVAFEYYDLGTEQELEFSGLAYSGSVVEHMLGMEIVDVSSMQIFSKTEDFKIPIFDSHNTDKPIGHGFVKIDDNKVFLDRALLYGDDGEKKYGMMKKGFPFELSIGFEADLENVRQLEYGQYKVVNGVEVTHPVTVWENVQLNEISLVAFGADRNTDTKLFRAMKSYKAKGKQEMAKKIKNFYECSCEEQKEQASKLSDQIKSMKEKRKEDEEVYSMLEKFENILSGLGSLVDGFAEKENLSKEYAEAKVAHEEFQNKFNEVKGEYDNALLKLEEYITKEEEAVLAAKKTKLQDAFKKLGKELTETVETEFMGMTEKQFEVALSAMETKGKSYLFNDQKTSSQETIKSLKDDEIATIKKEAFKIRQNDPSIKIAESWEMARASLGLKG